MSIHDTSSKKTIVATDIIGLRQIYYSETEDRITLSSDIKGLLCDMESDLDYDMKAIYELFTFSHPRSHRTFFKNIKILPGASVFIYDHQRNEGRVEKYWKYDAGHGKQQPDTENNLLEMFDDLFTNSIWQRIKDADSVGLFLSGGIDSRIIAGYCKGLCDRTNKHLVFYTVGAPGCIQDKTGKRVSATLGVEYQFLEIPDTQISSYANEIIVNGDGHVRIRDSHLISAFDKLALTHDCYLVGYMGGVEFGEGIRRQMEKIKTKDELAEYSIKRSAKKDKSKQVKLAFREQARENFVKWRREEIKEMVTDLPDLPIRHMQRSWGFGQIANLMGPFTNFGNWYLPLSDPYLDKDLVDFAIHLPFDILADKGFLEKVLRTRFPALNRIEAENRNLQKSNYVSRGLYYIKRLFHLGLSRLKKIVQWLSHGRILFKSGDYRTYDYWLRTGSKDFCSRTLDLIDDDNPFGFDPKQIRRLWKDHLSCKADNNQILCDIMQIMLLDRYMHDRSAHRQQQ